MIIRQELTKEFLEENYVQKGLSLDEIARLSRKQMKEIRNKIKEYNLVKVKQKHKTKKENIELLEKMGFELMEEYRGVNIPILIKCHCKQNTFITKPRNLTNGSKMSCGCISFDGSNHSGWTGFKDVPGTIISIIKNRVKRSKTKNIILDITCEYIYNQYIKQDKTCVLSGEKLTWKQNQDDINGNASVDRIDSDKGYAKDNIQITTGEMNCIKGEMSNDFLRFIASKCLETHPDTL